MCFKINKVAVIGAGVMGSSIAAHIAGATGIPVCLLDIVPKEFNDEEKAKGLSEDSPEFRNRFAQTGKDRIANPKNRAIYDSEMAELIEVGNTTDNFNMISDCDWIIEVVAENLEIKKELMKKICENRKQGSIVSTNTSGVSINQICAEMPMEFRLHFLGTHFFNPPRYMKLFELIPSKDTHPMLVRFMQEFATKRLGKGVIIAKDTPNFISNRLGSYAYMDIVRLTEKYGYSIEKVDQLTGTAIGRPKAATYRLFDMVGLDIVYNATNNVANNLEDAGEKAKFAVPEIFGEMIKKGYLGDKTKQGFYKKVKTEKGNQQLVWDPGKGDYIEMTKESADAIEKAGLEKNRIKALAFGDAEENRFVWESVKNILLYSASKVPEIADDYKDIDKGLEWGYNWSLGPFKLWDAIGFEESVVRMKNEGETIPEWIDARIASGKTKFYDGIDSDCPTLIIRSPKNSVIQENQDAAIIDIGDDIICLNFKSKGNSISDLTVEMMEAAVLEAEKNCKGLVIGNQSSNFSFGANLVNIGTLAQGKDWKTLEASIDGFQKANLKLKYCRVPVVAAPYSMTLGGGAEITMHSHVATAHPETYMGLVEVGVGLIPGGGGTKELLFRAMDQQDQITTGETVSRIRKVFETISMAKVSGSAYDAIRTGYLRKEDKVVMNQDYLIEEAKKTALYLYESGFRPLQKKTIKATGETGKAALAYIIEMMKDGRFISEHDALIAKKIAHILAGGNVPTGSRVTEEQILELEKEAFLSLCGEEKTLDRIAYMLKNNKPLRN